MSPSLLLLLGLCAAPAAPAVPAAPAAPAVAPVAAAARLPPAPRPRELLQGFDAPLGKTFSGNFDDTPADLALRKILDAAGLSVVLPHGLKEPVNASFKDAAIEDALRAICAEAGVVAVRRGTVVTIERGGPTAPARQVGSAAPAAVREDGEGEEDARAAKAEAEQEQRETEREAADEARQQAEEQRREKEDDAAEAASEGQDQVSSGDVTLGPGQRVRDLLVMRGNATLGPGSHAREVTAMLGNVEVGPGALVDHDVVAIRGNVHLLPGAQARDATSIGGRVIIDPGASVRGQTARLDLPPLPMLPPLPPLPGLPPPPVHHPHQGRAWLIGLGKLALEFALYFSLGLIVLAAWPRRLERVIEALRLTPARSTAVGLLGALAIPLLALLLAVTLVGLLLWPVEAVLVVAGAVLGYTALAVLIGRALPLRRRVTPVAQLALGTLAITLVTHLPGVGLVLGILGLIVVLGAVLATRFGATDPTDAATFPLGSAVDPAATDAR